MPDRTLSQLRRAAGLTQPQLARRLGVSESTVAKWDIGLRTPNTRNLARLARALGVSAADLAAALSDLDQAADGDRERGEDRMPAPPPPLRGSAAAGQDGAGGALEARPRTLRAMRQAAGLTLRDVARALDVSESVAHRWDRGRSTPKTRYLPRLARLLGVSTGDLVDVLAVGDPRAAVEPPDADSTAEPTSGGAADAAGGT